MPAPDPTRPRPADVTLTIDGKEIPVRGLSFQESGGITRGYGALAGAVTLATEATAAFAAAWRELNPVRSIQRLKDGIVVRINHGPCHPEEAANA